MKIECIIVDDEPASREILEKYIADYPILTLAKACKNAYEANDFIKNHDINLIFLDINMPGLSGMKFYKSLANPPFVIFTTAYPEFAVEGFEVNAIDYLLKPFSFERFMKAVNKAVEIIKNRKSESISLDFILLKADKKIYRILIHDITYIEAVGDYVRVNCNSKSIMVHETFRNLLDQLPENQFIRVHKSYAISVSKFDIIEGNIVKIGGEAIPIGHTYRDEFMNRIKSSGSR